MLLFKMNYNKKYNMADKKLIDIDRLSRYHENINTLLATKQESLVSGDNIKTINGESILGSGNIESLASKEYVDEKSNSKVFIGTLAEYQEAYAAGKIAVGALVIIMDEGEDSNDAIALLGTAVLGKMILGQK